MAANAQYDYEAIHRAVCPEPLTLTDGQRANREWPAAQDMVDFLGLLGDAGWQDSKGCTPFNDNQSAYHQAMNNGLLTGPRQVWANGAPCIKHRLTSKGQAYLCYLKVITRKPQVARETLRRYERRFSTAARWAGALVQAQRYAALNALAATHDAHVRDMMAVGAI